MNLTYPNLIVIGASKCGTTALYHYLSKHPEIFVPSKKELHFHSRKQLFENIGGPGDKFIIKEICADVKSYEKHFSSTNHYKFLADVSPSYLFFPESIESIKKVCGEDIKIVCLVRHPVDKMVSQYTHLYFDNLETLSFEEALKEEIKRKKLKYSDMWLYRESGYMSDKILRYKKNFKNVFVINNTDLYNNLKITLESLFEFIGVDKAKFQDFQPLSKNFSGVPKSKFISKLFINPNFFTYCLRRIVPQKIGYKVRQWISEKNKGEKYTIDNTLYRVLEGEFISEIENLNKIIDSQTKIEFKKHNVVPN